MIRGSTYPIDIVSRNPNGWEAQWFDSGTGTLEISSGSSVVKRFDLDDSTKIKDKPGRYRVFFTVPIDAPAVLIIQAYGVVDSFPMRTALINITTGR